MLDIIKWYLIVVSIYFLLYYFHFACTTARRDKIFPSLLETMNHIRETKDSTDGFICTFIWVTVWYVVVYAFVVFVLTISVRH